MPKTVAAKKGAPKKAAADTPKVKRRSRRAQQRLIALRMGLERGTIEAEELREACRKADVYNAPNFKQDMKKEAVLFNPVQKGGKTVAWKLTAIGKQAAKAVAKTSGRAGKAKVSKAAKDEKPSPEKEVAEATA